MKIFYVLFMTLAIPIVAFGNSRKPVPMTGDDIARMLNLQAYKNRITFDKFAPVTVKWSSKGKNGTMSIEENVKFVDVCTYVSNENKKVKDLEFWVTIDSGAVYSSSFPIDSSKSKFYQTQMINGIYTITGYETEDFSKPPGYKIEVIQK